MLARGVDTVALESTGVYWIPVYEVLEQRGLTIWLVNARQTKYVPGRKSDVLDCQWLQKLMSLGLLRAPWRPDGEVCVIRAVARQREVLFADQASWVLRMQKALVQMNLQLAEVLTDVMGMTGRRSSAPSWPANETRRCWPLIVTAGSSAVKTRSCAR